MSIRRLVSGAVLIALASFWAWSMGVADTYSAARQQMIRLIEQDVRVPIGYGQTISQPYIVAIMTDLIAPRTEHKALEIGTGSGYQAAVLSRLVKKVYTMEIVEPLGKQATERLKRLGFDNIEVSIADGYYGWKEHAPFDIIIVTAAASHIPPPLIEQLKPGGKMIIPVGSRFMTQQLLLVDKGADKEVTVRQILPVRFVPLTGEH
ncbi:MAG: protein-L-isoaspartate(D-aspartate) O-methyltransferase [Candidatus Thiodiazotropha endolucinida]